MRDPDRIDKLRNALARLEPDWSIGEAKVLNYLADGYSNENYLIGYHDERYVLRLPQRARPFIDRDLEARYHATLEAGAGDLRPAPLVALDTTSGAMLTRFVPGRHLNEAQPTVAGLARYLRGLHAALPGSGRSYDPVALARGYLRAGAADAWIRQLADTLSWQPQERCPCHNDLNPWNVIVPDSGGGWVTLDWEWVGDNDPLFDLVSLHQGLGWDVDSLQRLAADGRAAPPSPERLQRCLLGYWLREYGWAHSELAHGNRREVIEVQLETSRRRLRALAG